MQIFSHNGSSLIFLRSSTGSSFQHVDEQFVARSRRLMEQIRTLYDQLDAMDVANNRRCQRTPRFVDDDDVITFNEARSQRKKV